MRGADDVEDWYIDDYSCIGFSPSSHTELVELYKNGVSNMNRISTDLGTAEVLHFDESAQLWFYDRPGERPYACKCLPFFQTGKPINAKAGKLYPSLSWGCPFLRLNFHMGQDSLPIIVELVNHLDCSVQFGDTCLADVVFFADRLNIYSDLNEYMEKRDVPPALPCPYTEIDAEPDPSSDLSLIAEVIGEPQRRINLMTGLEYAVFTLDLWGIPFTAASSLRLFGGRLPKAGNVVFGLFHVRGYVVPAAPD